MDSQPGMNNDKVALLVEVTDGRLMPKGVRRYRNGLA